MADERQRLREELEAATGRLEEARGTVHGTFVNLALRTLALVERQLGVIEGLEEREQDPERLGTLFKLDHLATVMRRHSENLLVLAGAEHGQQHAGPVPLVDVVRAAVSEIERYDRVRIAALPPHAHVTGFAADDLSHLLAELLENATSFSPPDASVEISGWLLENGEVMLSVQDEGIGITPDRLTRLNARLTGFDPERPYGSEDGEGLGLGLYVVARLAHRHGARVRLRAQKQGGSTAVTVLPKALLAGAEAAAVAAPGTPAAPGTESLRLPGAGAEANSNVLPTRARPVPSGEEDPLIAAAEATVRAHEARTADPAADAPEPSDAPGAPDASETPVDGSSPAPAEEAARDEAPAPHGDAAGDEAPVQHGAAASPEGGAGRDSREEGAVTSETTMELLAPAPAAPETAPAGERYSIGPDSHERSVDETDTDTDTETGTPAPAPGRAPRLTAKGLPKRTPRISAPVEAPRARTGGVDAEALRRRLGGFHQGRGRGPGRGGGTHRPARRNGPARGHRPTREDRPARGNRPDRGGRPGRTDRARRRTCHGRTRPASGPGGRGHIGGHCRGGNQLTASTTFGLSSEARNLQWLLTNLVEEVPGILSVAVVSSDGLLLLSSDPGALAAARTAGGDTPPAPAVPPPTSRPSSPASAASRSAPRSWSGTARSSTP